MKKIIYIVLALLLAVSFSACSKKISPPVKVVKTYSITPVDQIEQKVSDSDLVVSKTHYEMSDGTWKTATHEYKYRLELTGRLNNAVKDSTYVVLSNSKDITFEQAWKSSGLSSNSKDYFAPENAVVVGMK